MIRSPTRQTARRDIEAACLAIKPTSGQIARMCASFVAMVAEMTNQRVVLTIGQAVIARGSK